MTFFLIQTNSTSHIYKTSTIKNIFKKLVHQYIFKEFCQIWQGWMKCGFKFLLLMLFNFVFINYVYFIYVN